MDITPFARFLLDNDIPIRSVLEVFAGEGGMTRQVQDFTPQLHLCWDIDSAKLRVLRNRCKRVTAKTVDSYKEVLLEQRKFDWIIIDNGNIYETNGVIHYEYFDLFPYVLELLKSRAALTLNIRLDMGKYRERFRARYNVEIGTPEHLKARKEFYGRFPEDLYDMIAAHFHHFLSARSLFLMHKYIGDEIGGTVTFVLRSASL
jgi:hypothetical protein